MKINDQIFLRIQKTLVLDIFIVGAKKVFSQNQVVMHNFIRVSGIMPTQRKSKSKETPRQMSGNKDGQNLCHRILPATTMGLRSKTTISWDLKVKDTEYDVAITKNHYIKVSFQKSAQFTDTYTKF